ncbi:MAG: hypothetical protein ACXIU8_14475 [Alkalilacustris sp.]
MNHFSRLDVRPSPTGESPDSRRSAVPLRVCAALGVGMLLGACNMAALPPILDPTPAPAPSAPGVDADGQRAIAACLNQAEARGLTVSGVSNASEIRNAAGRPVGQNVFVDVTRGTQTFNVRCNYSYASAQARIMTL